MMNTKTLIKVGAVTLSLATVVWCIGVGAAWIALQILVKSDDEQSSRFE